jgi:hypothetical protein
VQKGVSVPLVWLENTPANGRIENSSYQQDSSQRKYCRVLPLQARQERAHCQHGHQNKSGSQVGLLEYQNQRNTNQNPSLDQITQIKLIRAHFRKEACQYNDYNQFHQF